MAKRFTDSDKWKKPWFRRLKPVHKCFWAYVLDNCNNAGIWEVDFELASIHVGEEVNAMDTMEIFRKQYFPFALGKRWFIIDFVEYQYGDLKTSSNAHVAVINTLKKYGLYEVFLARKKAEEDQHYENQPVLRDPRRVQRQEEEQAKDKDPDLNLGSGEEESTASDVPTESIAATKATLLKHEFDLARKAYPGTRGGLTVEWENFEKKNRGHIADIIPKLMPAILAEKIHKDKLNETRVEPLQWKHFTTWINKRCWEQELEEINGQAGSRGGNRRESRADRLDRDATELIRELRGAQGGNPPADQPDFSFCEPGEAGT